MRFKILVVIRCFKILEDGVLELFFLNSAGTVLGEKEELSKLTKLDNKIESKDRYKSRRK